MSENLRNKFRFDCQQEIAKLQVLGDGSIKCEFDPSQKIALTPTTHLAFLEHERLKQEMLNGKEDDYRLSGLLVTELEHLDGNDRIEREVELLEQYGGRFSQQRAYQIKVQNIELFLDKYNEGKAEDDKLSLSDFRKVMFNEYEKGVLEWGSLEDKLSVLQRSPEYLRENAKTRKEMLEKRREELMSQANKVKVETIKFEPKLDSKGRPVINDYSKSITAFMDIVEEAVATGTTSSIPKFSMGLYDSLSKDEKRLYDTAETISDATARKVDTTAMREVRFASKVSHNYVNDLRNEQQQISQRVEELSEESKVYRHVRDYERLYRVSLALQAEKDVFNENCQNLETKMDNVPFEELQVDTTTQIENELDLARAQYKAEEIKVDKAKKIFEKGYERQVDYWAYADFAKRYKREYERHVKFMKRSVGNIEISEQSLQASFYTEMCKDNPSRAESLKNEVETYKVKHHIEENVSAEVYAEVHSDEFARFIDERNAKSELGQLDPASEIAKCYFYAYSKRENPLKVQQFNRYFKKKCNERAKQRLMDKTLGVHGQEIFKHQVSSDQNLNNDANLEQYNDEEEVLLGA